MEGNPALEYNSKRADSRWSPDERRNDGRTGVRAMPGPSSAVDDAPVGTATQSGQINFQLLYRRSNVIVVPNHETSACGKSEGGGLSTEHLLLVARG